MTPAQTTIAARADTLQIVYANRAGVIRCVFCGRQLYETARAGVLRAVVRTCDSV